ncbi:hypothetical protein [Actinoplanes sp. NPDC026670]|uniref:hypothetical protein n=1 Tax=Actinoplanes sp. NPDC026670 TaxID=3154700 RepID=UPI0033D9AF22
MPTFDLIRWSVQLSAGNGLVVVDPGGPARLTGWAGALGAVNLDTGARAALDPRVRDLLAELVSYGANDYASSGNRDRAHRLLTEMAAAGQMERAVVLGALLAYGASSSAMTAIARLIDLILPVATWLADSPE